MTQRVEVQARARRQERVGKVVWGSLFVVMGVLFTLHDMGRIDLRPPHKGLTPGFAVDGDPATRWSSAFSDPQWLAVDLGEVAAGAPDQALLGGGLRDGLQDRGLERPQQLDHRAHGDGRARRRGRTRGGRDGPLRPHVRYEARNAVGLFPLGVPGVRSLGHAALPGQAGHRLDPWRASAPSPTGRCSGRSCWWPAGLPLLVAPRDDSNQLLGLVLVAVGTFLQLQRLGVVSWGFRRCRRC